MKKLLIGLTLSLVSICAGAQTWDEWFSQKSTQIKYLLAQIAANQIYIDALQKGCSIAQEGLTAINHINHGDFNLHNDYFSSLKSVNPKIINSDKVTGIVNMQMKIKTDLEAAKNQLNGSSKFTTAEQTYLQKTSAKLLNECITNIDALTILLSSGQVSMTDDERIKRIDKIHKTMQEYVQFEKSFTSSFLMLGHQRNAEQTDAIVSKQLNGLK